MLGKQPTFIAVACAALLSITSLAQAAPARPEAPEHTGPDPTYPNLSQWVPVFKDEFDGKFNDGNITDAINTRGTATPDGLDDRIWHLLPYSQADPRTDAAAISVTSTAPGGVDPGQPADGYLNLRTFSQSTGNHKYPGMLSTGSNGSDRTLRFESTYGYIETRMRVGDRPGVGSDFFTFSRDLTADSGKPLRDQAAAGTEIDIFEHSESATGVTQNLHWDGYTDMHESTGSGPVACPHVSTCVDGFHTYGLLWGPTGYRYFIDGHETSALAGPVSHHPLYLVMSQGVRSWTEGSAATQNYGAVGTANNPLTLVDYVKVWQPAVSDMPVRSTPRNVPVAIPFTVSSLATGAGAVPAPRVTSLTTTSSRPSAIHSTEDLKITGTGADRTLLVRPGRSSYTGPVTITVTANNGTTVLGSDSFVLTLTAAAPNPPVLTALPDQVLTTTSGPAALAFTTTLSNPTWDVPGSSNDYLVPDGSLGFSGNTGQTRALSIPPLPDRTGTTLVTVTARSGSLTETKTFSVTVGLPTLANGGFEAGLAPWQLGGTGAVAASARHSGAQGLHVDLGAATQRITVAPNTTYTLGAWGRTSSAGGVFDLGVLDTVRDDYDNNGAEDVPDGDQRRQVRFDSTAWAEKSVTFTTGRFTRAVDVFVNNFTVSTIGFDVDDATLGYGPEIQHLANQSIGHATCVRPPFNVGRVGDETDPWTVTAAVTAGDATLLQAGGLAVETAGTENWPGNTNLFRRALKITPQTAQNRSGQLTVTLTATDRAGRTSTRDVTVWVNAGSFRNGGFETEPDRDTSAWLAPGCTPNPAAWVYDPAATGIRWEDRVGSTWNGYPNKGLVIGTGKVSQVVTGLEANTVYVLSGDVALEKQGQGTGFAGFLVGGPEVAAVNGGSLSFARTTDGWQRGTVSFTTGASGQATVELYSYSDKGAQFHDITLLKA